MTRGVMREAGLNSEHLLPSSVLRRDTMAIEERLTRSRSPTIMIDEDLHRAGMTYGKGINALIYDYTNPLTMIDAVIDDYIELLHTIQFEHLDKAKYKQGFEEMRRTYIQQYPNIFDPERTKWWTY